MFGGTLNLVGQDILLDETVDSTEFETEAPSRKIYTVFGFLFPVSEGTGKTIIEPQNSLQFNFGIGYLRRLSNTISVGGEIEYSGLNYRIEQTLIDKELINFNYLNINPSIRIITNPRNEKNGFFMQFGGFAGWAFATSTERHSTLNTNPAISEGSKAEVIIRDLNFVETFQYGSTFRFGFNNFALTGRYRASNLFTHTLWYDELPTFHLGLEFGF